MDGERKRNWRGRNLTEFILFHWLYFFYCMPEFVIVGTFPKLNNHIKQSVERNIYCIEFLKIKI